MTDQIQRIVDKSVMLPDLGNEIYKRVHPHKGLRIMNRARRRMKLEGRAEAAAILADQIRLYWFVKRGILLKGQ